MVSTRLAHAKLLLPLDVRVTDSVITWSGVKHRLEIEDADLVPFDDLDVVLADFKALAAADPPDMGAFIERYGLLSICAHGYIDGHDQETEGGWCAPLDVDGRPGVKVRHVRAAARAFLALADWGRTARLGLKRPDVGMDIQSLLSGIPRFGDATEREQIAWYLTRLNREAGGQRLITWDKRLSITYEADGLMGLLADWLTREIAAGEDRTYRCSVCSVEVERVRPPQPGEPVYCTKPSCKREQKRRNQAAWRARKRAEGAES